MARDAKAEKLIAKLKRQEDATQARRVANLLRAIKSHGSAFLNDELGAIEEAVHAAVGRVVVQR